MRCDETGKEEEIHPYKHFTVFGKEPAVVFFVTGKEEKDKRQMLKNNRFKDRWAGRLYFMAECRTKDQRTVPGQAYGAAV